MCALREFLSEMFVMMTPLKLNTPPTDSYYLVCVTLSFEYFDIQIYLMSISAKFYVIG